MKILTYPLGQLQANCYFLIERDECLIIDPADEASFILEELQRRKLKLIGMLATHGHFDHVMAVGEIQKTLDTNFFISKADQFLIERLEETANYFLGYNPVILKPASIKHLIEARKKIGLFDFEVLKTAGHTPGSQCYYFKKEKLIFTGDTLFKRGIGRHDFSYSDKRELKKSLQTLIQLPGETIAYPGHGDQTRIGEEKNIIELFNL